MNNGETFEQHQEQLKNPPMPSPDAIKEELAKMGGDKPVFDESDPRNQEEYTFQLDYKDGRGKSWKGPFTTKILTIKEEIESGLMQARLNNHTPKEALDLLTDELNFIVSRTTYCLKDAPSWWKPLELTDPSILQEVYKEIASHEAFFRRPIANTSKG